MKFSFNWIQDLVSGKLPLPEKMAELLTMHSFEINEVAKAGKDHLIDIDVLPNRASDCFSHLGIARECAILTGKALKEQKIKPIEEKTLKAKDFVTVGIKNQKACPRYSAKVVTGIKVGPAPEFIQERLKVCGLRPINNIVDIANYVMLEVGQPLHAFDQEKLSGKKIIVRFARKGEKITTLDDMKYVLNPEVLVIADNKAPVAIAGIKGGKEPEIDKKTKTVVIEAANFEPHIIRRGSRKINLKTDASLRFEHGMDPNLTEEAINLAAFLMQKFANGKIVSGLIDVYPKKVLPKRIILEINYLESLLGMKIPGNEITRIFKSLDFKIFQKSKKRISVLVPTRRKDINLPVDLIEEIGRIYGYEKIPSVFPLISLSPPKRNDIIFWENLTKRILKELSFTEVFNYSFVGEKTTNILGYKSNEMLEIENPVSEEQKYLKPSLVPNLLFNLQKNQRHFDDIRIFELGKIFKKGKILEKRMLSGAILRKNAKTGSEIFFEVKGIIDSLLNQLGSCDIWYDFCKPTPENSKASLWQPKKSAEIKVGREEIGFLGEISPKILDELKLDRKIVFFEIDFEKLLKLCSEEHEYRPLSRYPAAVRDLAVLVPRKVLVEQVLNQIETVGGKVVRDIDLFDIYEGEELPEDKKNLAFHIIYQAEDRTLKSTEVDDIQKKIIKRLEENLNWEVRK